jgi:5-methyltetrahydrofolate--homocysteine methyltransferase
MVVMTFDEKGQMDSFVRKMEVCTRAYCIHTEEAGVVPQDLIFQSEYSNVARDIEERKTVLFEQGGVLLLA